MNILNSDATAAGYKDACEDAKQNPPRPKRGGMNLRDGFKAVAKNLLTLGVYDFDYAWKTYCEGYEKGYTDTLRSLNTTQKVEISSTQNTVQNNSNLPNTSNMPTQTSYAYQIELAEELKSYLHGFQERLAIVAQNYERKVNSLHAGGMMDETHTNFVEFYLEPTKVRLQDLIDQINDADIPFVEKYIDYLESHL